MKNYNVLGFRTPVSLGFSKFNSGTSMSGQWECADHFEFWDSELRDESEKIRAGS